MKRTLLALLTIALLSLGAPLLAQDYPPPAEPEAPSESPDVDVDVEVDPSLQPPPDVDVDVDIDADADTMADEDVLPATASELPLVGLLGLAAVGAGLGLSIASRRK